MKPTDKEAIKELQASNRALRAELKSTHDELLAERERHRRLVGAKAGTDVRKPRANQ